MLLRMRRLTALLTLALTLATTSPRVRAQSRAGRPVSADVGIARRAARAGLVPGREVRHLHPLGRLFGPLVRRSQGIRRVVLALAAREPWDNARSKQHHKETVDFHNRVFGPTFSYYQFAPMFKAELFDPDEWAAIFKQSGAKYVALTSKHHEGFCMFQSAEANRDWGQPWNAVDIGPKRDLLGDLSTAVRKAGLKMGFYYSLYEWFNPLWLNDHKLFVDKHLFPQFKDVVTRYKPSIIFGDGEWDMTSAEWRSPELLAWLYNESPVKDDVIVNDRWGKRHAAQARRVLHDRVRRRAAGRDAPVGREPRDGLLVRLQPERAAQQLPHGPGARVDVRGHGVARRQPAAQHRPARRRQDPRGDAAAAEGDGRLAGGQRRGHLRHARVDAHGAVDRRARSRSRASASSA